MEALFQIGKFFRDDPVGFAEVVLGVKLSEDQKTILNLLTRKPYKCLVRSANSQGKSYLAAVAALWTFCCFDPSITIITSATQAQVARVVFKELRNLGSSAFADFFSPKAPQVFHRHNHQIIGYTSTSGTAMQGIHDCTVSAIVDEATGVDGEFIEAIEPMVAGPGHYTLILFNPTDTSSYPYFLERTGKVPVVHLNALKHPNIEAELLGQEPPFPNAIRLDRLREMVGLWCEPALDSQPEDFEFDGKLWHPSPVAEARLLGRYPSQASNAVWSEALFEKAVNLDTTDDGSIQIGVDVAVYGDDDTVLAVRKGKNLIHLESHSGWSPLQTAARAKELSVQYRLAETHKPPIVIDETGVGIAVSCQGGDYNFIGVNFAGRSNKPMEFSNIRNEVHFTLADKARKGEVSFKRLPRDQREMLRLELLSAQYKLDYQGRRVLESKDQIKAKIGKSPDAAEAVMLAFMEVNADIFKMEPPKIKREPRKLLF